jgi:hypothetical protein
MGKPAAIVVAVCFAVVGYAGTVPRCEPLPGAAALWSRSDLRFVLIGEIHGTAESPAIFRDLVCAATSSQRSIVIGIERETREQKAIDAFMARAGHAAATSALLAQSGWSVLDGRSSRAMLLLLEALRALKRQGRISEVVAFDDARASESPAQREQRMASALMAAADRHANALVIALTGNLHPSKKLIEGSGSYSLVEPNRRSSENTSG